MRPRLHPGQRLVQRAAGEAQRGSADGGAEHVQHRHGQLEPFARLPDQRILGQDHALHAQGRQRMRRDDLQPLGNLQPRGVGGHQEGRQAARPRRLAGAGKKDVEVGDAAVRDPGLLALDQPAALTRVAVVAVAATSDPDPGSVSAKAEIAVPCTRPFQPSLLRGRAEQADGSHPQPLHGKGEIRKPIMPRQRFADQAQGAHVQPLPRRRPGMSQPPVPPSIATSPRQAASTSP